MNLKGARMWSLHPLTAPWESGHFQKVCQLCRVYGKCPPLEVVMKAPERRNTMQTQTENQSTAYSAAKSAETTGPGAAQLPLLDGTYVTVTVDAKREIAEQYGIISGAIANGEVQVWLENARIVTRGRVLSRSASYVSLKDILACWIYGLKYLLEDTDQRFVLKDGNTRNLLPSNIGVSQRRPAYR
jgi:hypothetical protein